MSIAAMAYVWEHSSLKGTDLNLLLAIADYANAAGVAWPSIGSLAKRIRCDDRTTQRALKRIRATGELRIKAAGGPKGAHLYQVVIVSTLPLFFEPEDGRQNATRQSAGVAPVAKRGGVAMPPEPSGTVIKTIATGQSPVAQCAAAYRQGIKARYGADYPGSAKLNGIMAQLVKELGAEPALQVVQAYLASGEKWYVTKRHALEYLKRDGAQIWVQLQERSGTPSRPPAKADLSVEWVDGQVSRLAEYPTDAPEILARRLLKDYASKFTGGRARNIHVQIGANRYPFSVAELRA